MRYNGAVGEEREARGLKDGRGLDCGRGGGVKESPRLEDNLNEFIRKTLLSRSWGSFEGIAGGASS